MLSVQHQIESHKFIMGSGKEQRAAMIWGQRAVMIHLASIFSDHKLVCEGSVCGTGTRKDLNEEELSRSS